MYFETENKYLERNRKVISGVVNKNVIQDEEYYNIFGLHSYFMSNFDKLDRKINAFTLENLTVIAGCHDNGKWVFALNILINMIDNYNVWTAVFSFRDRSPKDTLEAILSIESGLPLKKMQEGTLGRYEVEKLRKRSYPFMDSLPMIMDVNEDHSLEGVRDRIRKYKKELPLGVILIDKLQLFDLSSKDGTDIGYATIAKSLKALAKELRVVIIVLSDLPLPVEEASKKEHRRPRLQDLRMYGEGIYNEAADTVLMMYRKRKYQFMSILDPDYDIVELHIAKSPNGRGLIKIHYDMDTLRMNETKAKDMRDYQDALPFC